MRDRNEVREGRLNLPRLLAYVADLELEVDRLRRHTQLLYEEAADSLARCQQGCEGGAEDPAAALGQLAEVVRQAQAALRGLRDRPGYHPAHDQVVPIAVRPVIEQVFRWQQRLQGAPGVVLTMELEAEHVEWFPARLRHILDNLIASALSHRSPDQPDGWVQVGLRLSPQSYQFTVSDDGVGLGAVERDRVFEQFYRGAPAREAGLGVGLAVVRLLVEQSGGSLTVGSSDGRGTSFVAVLPRYEIDDFLT